MMDLLMDQGYSAKYTANFYATELNNPRANKSQEHSTNKDNNFAVNSFHLVLPS